MIILVFIIGYLGIIVEHYIGINKAATALITGIACWLCLLGNPNLEQNLQHSLGEISSILFFLLGAMTVVELIDAHNGFSIITNNINATKTWQLMVVICTCTFFLSAVLDNLTTTIVMVSILKKLIKQLQVRMYLAGLVIIAANAGGAFSPIGDVTTTMLWVGGQITELGIIKATFIPSLLCIAVPLIISCLMIKEKISKPQEVEEQFQYKVSKSKQVFVFIMGISILLMVPVFKIVTHLPPYMGMLLGLGVLWVITELMHSKKQAQKTEALSMVSALQKIDTPSILFFLGILLSVSALQVNGTLQMFAQQLQQVLPNTNAQVFSLGLLSALVDNVPLVAASQGMYNLPTDSFFWHFLAYCTGTGGSLLIIGSAAGVVAMGMENINFIWYIKKITSLALIGYMAGALYMVLQ